MFVRIESSVRNRTTMIRLRASEDYGGVPLFQFQGQKHKNPAVVCEGGQTLSPLCEGHGAPCPYDEINPTRLYGRIAMRPFVMRTAI